jgi:ankyrin repeat protein
MPFWNLFRKAKIEPKDETEFGGYEEDPEPPFPMFVMRLHKLIKKYGGQRHPKIESYETLKEDLVEWSYVKKESTIIYISHEWVGTDHPDPDGTQLFHLLLLLERLQRGEIPRVDMDPIHAVTYNHNFKTTAQQWMHILTSEKTYIWYDGFCIPKMREEDEFCSIPMYIRRCDFTIILVPGCIHADRIDPTTKRKMNLCYRTYRLRAMCVLEMFASFLCTKGGEQAKPMLLVRSGMGTPFWVSPLECQKLAVGTSSFECCETNHTILKCRRSLSRLILDRLIEIRVRSLFSSNNVAVARLSFCFRNYWCRGLFDESSKRSWRSLDEFKSDLRWNLSKDGVWIDRDGFSLLNYAVISGCIRVVQETLVEIEKNSDRKTRVSHMQVRAPSGGIPELGISGRSTTLMASMAVSGPEIVSLLLDHGADPSETDTIGFDAFMIASTLGRIENVKYWLKRFPEWDVKRKNKIAGDCALSLALFQGPRRLEILKVLMEHGASLNVFNDLGASVLIGICCNEDVDLQVLQLLVQKKEFVNIVNYQISARSVKWRIIQRIAQFLTQNKLTDSGIVSSLAYLSGSTAIRYAATRGDIDLVDILLQNGADPSIKNDLGFSAVDCCHAFPELRGGLKRLIEQQRINKKNTITLHRRISTATEMKFPMYLIPLDQLQRMYGGKDARYGRIEAHQELKRRGELVRWEDLPFDAHIIFLSHEWVGWSHPDPHGIQLKTFLKVMKRLCSGEIKRVEMSVMHMMIYKQNYVVDSKKWKEVLSTTYVWIDWSSMPQPSACPPVADKKEKEETGINLGKAVKSIPAYVAFFLSFFLCPHLSTQQYSKTDT